MFFINSSLLSNVQVKNSRRGKNVFDLYIRIPPLKQVFYSIEQKNVFPEILLGGTRKYAGAAGTYKETARVSAKSPAGTDTLDGDITY